MVEIGHYVITERKRGVLPWFFLGFWTLVCSLSRPLSITEIFVLTVLCSIKNPVMCRSYYLCFDKSRHWLKRKTGFIKSTLRGFVVQYTVFIYVCIFIFIFYLFHFWITNFCSLSFKRVECLPRCLKQKQKKTDIGVIISCVQTEVNRYKRLGTLSLTYINTLSLKPFLFLRND